MGRSDLVRFDDVEVYAATDLALLVGPVDDEDAAVWLPRSVVTTNLSKAGDTGWIDVPEWAVEQKEIDW